MVIFPEPQKIKLTGEKVPMRGCALALGAAPDELEVAAAQVIRKELAARGIAEQGGFRVVLGTPGSNPGINARLLQAVAEAPHPEQAYVLEITKDGAILAGNEPLGVLYAAQTLAQLLQESNELPIGTIADWPDMKYRGIFSEARWSNELMTLQDYKDAIDILAALKFNVLTVGIENNWQIQYDNKRNEYLLVPIKKYPQLRTPKWINYYSPTQGKMVHFEYIARMFEEDFFGEVIAYGKKRGISVRPHFNQPGHNTLIPTAIPEISAKDENGKPVGYGFCFTNPKTYEVMFDIFDEIIDRYLLPNGVRSFNVGMDEVYKVVGMDESEPTRSLSPFCQCEECVKKEWGDRFIDYAVAIAKHLVEKGITQVGIYHDQFVRSNRIGTALYERFKEEGLLDYIAIEWWQYGEFFKTIHPELGIKRWIMPMTGYYYSAPIMDHLQNIYNACQVGHKDGAEGASAYGVFARAFYRGFACLSEFTWKQGGDLDDFRDKYTRFLFGPNEKIGRRAFKSFDLISGPLSPQMWAAYHYHLAYAMTYDAAWKKANYPQYIVNDIQNNPLHVWNTLRILRWESQKAIDNFEKAESWSRDPADLKRVYPVECERIKASAGVFLALGEATKAYHDLQTSGELDAEKLAGIVKKTEDALTEIDGTMARIEKEIDFYLVPQMLREMTLHRNYLARYTEEVRRIADLAAKGELNALPELECLKCNDIRWIG